MNEPQEVFVTNRVTTMSYASEVSLILSVVQVIILTFIAFQVAT